MIGTVNSVIANNQMTFKGRKEGRQFRRAANNIISGLKKISPGTFEYTASKGKNQPSLQRRLESVVYSRAQAIGDEYVTPEDRKLHEKAKSLYKIFEERYDYMDAMCGGGGRFVDRTVNFTI
jgi:hypothetical protein